MGKVVSIVSSPRVGGNSDTIVNKIMSGAMGISTNTFSLYYLSKMHARGCIGCMDCKKTGKCSLNDEITKIMDDIMVADSLIVSTPIYFEQKCWSYRMFEDRLFSMIGNDGKSLIPPGKDLIIVVTYSHDYDAAVAVADHIESIMVGTFGFNLLGMILYCDHDKIDSAANDDEICELACSFGTSLSVAKPFNTYVVSIPKSDVRRGTRNIPRGYIWTSEKKTKSKSSK